MPDVSDKVIQADRERLIADLMVDEGFRGRSYRDAVGVLTIGYGRNLEANPLTTDEAQYLLEHDVDRAIRVVRQSLPWTARLDAVRQSVLVNMAFNLGMVKLLGFRRMLEAAKSGDFETAADEMLDSTWAQQVGHRAQRLAQQMRTGHHDTV